MENHGIKTLNRIALFIKNVYGVDKLYPVSNADQWRTITTKKTFDRQLCSTLEGLGFQIIIHDKGKEITYQTFFDEVK